MKKNNNLCPICKSSTYKLSKTTYIDKNTKLDWVSDSTFNLSKLKHVNVQMRICFKCCHSFLSPKFDTSLLYVDNKGYQERRKQYKSYYPEAEYHELNSSKNTILYGFCKQKDLDCNKQSNSRLPINYRP